MNYRLAVRVGIVVVMFGPAWTLEAPSGAEPSGSPTEAIRGFQGLYDNVARFLDGRQLLLDFFKIAKVSGSLSR